MSNIHIRWMIRVDLPAVLDIENNSFENAWTEDEFISCLRKRNCIGMVAEKDDCVVGFMIYELHKNSLALLNFAVDPTSRNCGVGSAMIERLASKLNPQRRTKVTTAISEKNLCGHLFFSRHGFVATKVAKDFFGFGDEDAYLFEYDLVAQHAGAVLCG